MQLLDATESWGEKAASVALWGIVGLIFFQVLFRYLLKVGLPWPDEMARYFHILVVFLCLGQVTRRGRHIRIDLVRQRLTGKAVERLFLLIQLIVSLVLVAGAIDIVARIGATRTPAANMPLVLFFLAPMVGFALVALESARKLLLPYLQIPGSNGPDVETDTP